MSNIELRPGLARHLKVRLQAFQDGFRQNLALIGLPGSGKTFQLQQVIAHSSARFIVIYTPLCRESCRSFLQRMLCSILQAGLDLPKPMPLEGLLARADKELPLSASAIRPIEALLARRAYSEAFNRALDAIEVLRVESGRACVVIFDEFLFFEELGLPHAFHELGKRVMIWPQTLFILASSMPYRARVILRERLQLLFGQFELLVMEALEPKRTAELVDKELRPLRGRRTVSPFLIHWLGSCPWYLCVFVRRLKELALLGRTKTLDESLFVQTAWDLIGSSGGTLHQLCASRIEVLAHIRHSTRALEALLQIADGARTATEIGRRIGRGGLAGALQLLVEHDLAERNGTCWVIVDPVVRCWLSTVLWMQHSEAPTDVAALQVRFRKHLEAIWMQYVRIRSSSFTDQVASLFGQFTDETVQLDHKMGRLPRFQKIEAQARGTGGAYLVAEGCGRRWCCSVDEGVVTERTIAEFDTFCRSQSPRPSRKVIVAKGGLEENAKLLAKTANMWVWGSGELEVLTKVYGLHV